MMICSLLLHNMENIYCPHTKRKNLISKNRNFTNVNCFFPNIKIQDTAERYLYYCILY